MENKKEYNNGFSDGYQVGKITAYKNVIVLTAVAAVLVKLARKV